MFIIFFVFVFFSDCKKKYPDDKWYNMHLSGTIQRLCRKWKIIKSEYYKPISCGTSSYNCTDYIHFKTDGTTWGGCNSPCTNLRYFAGTWLLVDGDNNLKLNIDISPSNPQLWTIDKLSKWNFVIHNDSVKFTLVPY